MIVFPVTNSPANYYFHLARFTFHVTRHLFRIIVTTAIVGSLSFVIINAILLAMQINTLPMFTKVGPVDISWKSPDDARVLLNTYSRTQQLKLNIGNSNYSELAETAGVKLNTDAILSSIQHPKGLKRIPLFNLVSNYTLGVTTFRAVDTTKLQAYVDQIQLPTKIAAIDAAVVVPSDVSQAPYIKTDSAGYGYTHEAIVEQLKNEATKNRELNVNVNAIIEQPKIKSGQLKSSLAKTNKLLENQITITNGTVSYKLSESDLRKMIGTSTDEKGLPTPIIGHDQAVDFLRSKSNVFYKAAEAKKVSTLDGNIVSSTDGANGQTVNIEDSANLLTNAIISGAPTQKLSMSLVSPSTTYLRNYTATSAGLLALISDFASSHSGKYKVVTFELGDDRSAYYNQDQSIVPASTYKVFLAYVALKKVEEGSLSMSSSTSAGSLDSCIYKMIHVSDNTCAKAILNVVGWAETDNYIHSAGYVNTSLNNSEGGYMSTTANDVAALLRDLYNGKLLTESNTDYLFGLMKEQIYRSGIPAGTPDAIVADKVGFLEDWNHDAAIVYAPNTTYVLVIMTTDSSFSNIKELAGQIYNLYNQ